MMRYTHHTFVPPTDLIELENKLVVIVEIAGMKEDDFDITISNRTLAISGIRKRPDFDQPAHHQVEIGYGEFRVVVKLPWSVIEKEVTATYQDGFLQIELPRRPEKWVRVTEKNNQGQQQNDG